MDLMKDATLEKLSREKSVRGAVVKKAMDRYANAEPEQKAVVEQALKMLLERFESGHEEAP